MKKCLPLCLILSLFINIFAPFLPFSFAKKQAFAGTTVAVSGTAKLLNTGDYLDFTNYSSNVVIVGSSGNFEGYAWAESFGWVAFGTTDNDQGPVNVNTGTGAVTGKAKVLNTGNYIDFTNYSSNALVNLSTGVFSGYAWSEDAGWIDFSDTGVSFADTEAPSPDPATFSSNPAADSTSQISMTATTATDNGFGAVEYYFDETSGGSGATDSDWQSSTSYSDSDLAVNTQYTYRVKSRDAAATSNETAYSAEISAYTLSNQPSAPTAEPQDYSSENAYWAKITIPATGGVPNDGNPAGTQYAVTIDGGTTWLTSTGGTSASKSWSATYSDYWYHKNLTANTGYTYHLLARNGDNTETALSATGVSITTAPAAPGNLSANNLAETSADISWDASSGADTYNLSYGTSPTASDTVVSDIASTSHSLSGLTTGTKYYYKVRSVSSSNGTGAYSAASYFYTTGDISLTLAVDSSSQITASWSESDGGDEIGFYLERATESDYSDASEIYSGLTPREFVSEGLDPNTVYYFRVRAEFEGSVFGSWNNSSAETLPSSPTALGLTASYSAGDGNKLALSWTSPGEANISNFKIFRGGNKDSGTLLATVASNVTAYTDTALTANTSYSYYVYGVNSSEGYSASETHNSEYTYAATPASLSVSGDHDSTNGYHADISWTTGGGQKEYKLYRGGDSTSGTLVYIGTALSYTDPSLSANTTYAYYVYATNENDILSPSYKNASDTTPPSQVLGFDYTPAATSITWKWTKISEAVSYKIYNSDDNSLITTLTASDAGCAGSSTTCSYKEESLVSNTAYSRYAKAYNGHGLGQASLTLTKYTLPSTPNSLIITGNDYSDSDKINLSLSWNSGGRQYRYKIFRGGNKDTGTLVTASGVEGASYTDTNLSANSTYTYYIYAINPDGEYSDYISGRGYTGPGQVSGLVVSVSASEASITWNWDSVSGASGYYVYDSSNNSQISKIESAGQTSITRTGLDWSNTYGIYVKAYNSYGKGQASNTVSATTIANPEVADTEAPLITTSHPTFGIVFPAPSGIRLGITNFKVWGYAEPISKVTVYHSFAALPGDTIVWEKLGEAQADGGGYFEFPERRYDYGVHYFRITATDAAGNISNYTDSIVIYIDTPMEIQDDKTIIEEQLKKKLDPLSSAGGQIKKDMDYFQKGLNIEFGETIAPISQNAQYFKRGLLEEIKEFAMRDIMTLPRRLALAFKDFIEAIKAPLEVESFAKSWQRKFTIIAYNVGAILRGDENLEIKSVKVSNIGKTSALVTWETNHYATSKVNYGKTLAFGEDVVFGSRVLKHEILITNLEPETTYYFEVLSHNGTAAFDAYHTFNTLP